jgi:CRISPR-associated protein Csb2
MYFVVRVRFLADYSGREWPPSPARLFKALVAVSRHGVPGADRDTVDHALRWIERCSGLNPPLILAPQVRADRPRLRRFVPNNSMIDPKTGRPEWPATRASKEPEALRVWRIDSRFEVVYAWTLESSCPEAEVLAIAARAVPSLGRGEDFTVVTGECRVDIPRTEGRQRYYPTASDADVMIEVPESGCLDVCLEMFDRRRRDPGWNKIHELPTMGTRLVAYVPHRTEAEMASPPIAVFALWRESRRYSIDARLLRVPAGQLRHLLSCIVDELVPALAQSPVGCEKDVRDLAGKVLLGHEPGGTRAEGPHVAIVPLPSVLGPYPDGRIRRIALIGFGCEQGEERNVFEVAMTLLHGRSLIDGGVDTGVRLRRETDDQWREMLLGLSEAWESITPVVLERRELTKAEGKHLVQTRRRAAEGDRTAGLQLRRLQARLAARREELIRISLERVLGKVDVEELEVSRVPFRSGVHQASEYRTADHLASSPRFHVRIRFAAPVRGPLVVGRGRYVGLGVLRTLATEVPGGDRDAG